LIDANLLILTSLNEGTPISIIEAQRMGRPVISTDVGSVVEVIDNGGSGYALQYSADVFAELILEFSNNQDKLTEFSGKAIRFSSEKFSPERLANDYLRIYKSLVSS
jgi:glycosyltransferase involved in cell wall biosynthesis